jgi:hypothetical protein
MAAPKNPRSRAESKAHYRPYKEARRRVPAAALFSI